MKKQYSYKNLTKLGDYFKCNFIKSNYRANNRFKSINSYKNTKLDILVKKGKIKKKKTQNIFELINIQELSLNHNHHKNYNYKKYIEINDKDNKRKYLKYDEIVLGKGGFGQCYLFRVKEDMDFFYAGKIIQKENVVNQKKSLLDEINIQKQFKDNPKVVGVKDYFEDDENVYIILELCKNRSLADYLKKRGGKLTEIEVKCFIFQLLQGLKCLHKNKIIHRDLKPNNLLLDDKNELKIGDFGIIANITKEKERRYTICGTYNYMAPEIFENNGKGYSFEVDIWSVGIIMYQLLTGNLIFDGDKKDIPNKILKFQSEKLDVSGISEVAADLIKQILVKDPKKRPGINQIIYHYFFHDNEFPKYITPEILNKIENEENKENQKEGKKEKLQLKLYSLIIDDIPEIEYENIKNYVIKESFSEYKQYIIYFHESIHYNCCYFEFNNEMTGIIFKNKENGSIETNILYNTETKFFYLINTNGNNQDDDEIRKYTKEGIQEEQKDEMIIFLLYLQKRKKIEVKDENLSIKEQNISSQSTNKSEQNSLSNENSIISQNRVLDKTNLIYVRKIITNTEASILFLSDKTIEAIFKDKIKILISDINKKIEFINQDNKINVVSTLNVFQNSSYDFTKRLAFIKKAIFRDIKNNLKANITENS